MKNSGLLLFIVGCSLMTIIATAQTITPDVNFGTNGVVTHDFFTADDIARDFAVQPDGKIVVAGSSVQVGQKQFMVSRYLADGTLDSTFGINGWLNAWFVNANNHATSLALQSDGKIVVAGHFDNNFFNDPVVLRFNSNGSPDATFGINGFVPFFLSNQFDEFHDVAIQPDGKIVASGRTWINNTYDFLTVRLMPDGSVDSTFGTNGKVITDFSSGFDCIFSLMIMPDGKILVSGNTEPGNSYFAAAKYLSNGTPDLTFGINGKRTIASGSRFDKAYGMAVQADGKIVLAGSHHVGAVDEYMFTRLSSAGNIDSTFGVNGISYLPTVDVSDRVNDIVIQSNGKILGCGNGDGNKAMLIRLQSDGMADSTFGTQGIYSGNMGSINSGLHALTLLPDQSILACGFTDSGSDFDFLVTKLLVSTSTAIDEHNDDLQEVLVYPNPATDYINIDLKSEINEPGTIRILDTRGRVIMEQMQNNMMNSFIINLPEGLTKGFYLLEVKTKSGVITSRLVAGN